MPFLSLAVLIDRAASEHKRRRREGTRLSCSRKPVTTLRGITWETSDTTRVSTTGRKQKTNRMIVVSLGAHLGVFSVLPRLRSVILTSPPPLSCQSPLPRSKRLTLLPWAASVPGAESNKTQVYHVYPTLAKPNSCCANVHRLSVFAFVCHRVHIAFVSFCVCLPSMSYCLSPASHYFIGRACRLNQSTNQSSLAVIFCLKCSVERPPQVTYDSSGTAKKHAHIRGY